MVNGFLVPLFFNHSNGTIPKTFTTVKSYCLIKVRGRYLTQLLTQEVQQIMVKKQQLITTASLFQMAMICSVQNLWYQETELKSQEPREINILLSHKSNEHLCGHAFSGNLHLTVSQVKRVSEFRDDCVLPLAIITNYLIFLHTQLKFIY